MTDEKRGRDDVDPADALGGAGAVPLPGGQPRGHVPSDRDALDGEAAPEAVDESGTTKEPDAPMTGDDPRP